MEGAPQPGCLTHVFSGPQRGAGEPGVGGVAEPQPAVGWGESSDGGATAEVVLGPLLQSAPGGDRYLENLLPWEQEDLEKGSLRGGRRCKSQSPPPGGCCHDNNNRPRQGQAGWGH